MRVGEEDSPVLRLPGDDYASKDTDELATHGQRLRLKKVFDISGFSPEAQAILKGLKKYGMFVADNGLDWTIWSRPIRASDRFTKSSARSRVGVRGGGTQSMTWDSRPRRSEIARW